jgi:hypothetical protein
MGKRWRVSDVVDGNDIKLFVVECGTVKHTADPAETVNRDPYRHECNPPDKYLDVRIGAARASVP